MDNQTVNIDCNNMPFIVLKGLIILRDKKCQKCGTGNTLQVHHKNGREDNNPINLITLCALCHEKEHGSTGRKDKKTQMPFIRKLIEDHGISMSTQIAPSVGMTRQGVTRLIDTAGDSRLSKIFSLVEIVNNILQTSYTVEEMFRNIDK